MADEHLAALITAIKEPTDEHLDALRERLDAGVSATGLFLSAGSADELIDAVRQPVSPAMGIADYGEPESTDGGATVRGKLPPGLPLSEVAITVDVAGGMVVSVLQEVVESIPAPVEGIDITGDVADFIDSAFERKSPIVLAYTGADGAPRVSYRGTLQSHGADCLAVWARNPEGGLLKAIQSNPRVSLLGSDFNVPAHYLFEGRARRSDDENVRRLVFDRSPEQERKIDAGRRGAAVIIDLDVVRGGPLHAMVHQRRSTG